MAPSSASRFPSSSRSAGSFLATRLPSIDCGHEGSVFRAPCAMRASAVRARTRAGLGKDVNDVFVHAVGLACEQGLVARAGRVGAVIVEFARGTVRSAERQGTNAEEAGSSSARLHYSLAPPFKGSCGVEIKLAARTFSARLSRGSGWSGQWRKGSWRPRRAPCPSSSYVAFVRRRTSDLLPGQRGCGSAPPGRRDASIRLNSHRSTSPAGATFCSAARPARALRSAPRSGGSLLGQPVRGQTPVCAQSPSVPCSSRPSSDGKAERAAQRVRPPHRAKAAGGGCLDAAPSEVLRSH
jgi:hypothetical protein